MIALNSSVKDSEVILETSENEVYASDNLKDLLNWTWELSYLNENFIVAWNLNNFVKAFVNLFPLDKRSELTQTKSCGICGFSFFYEPDRILSIKRGGRGALVYNLSQFAMDHETEPESLKGIVKFGEDLLCELKTVNLEPKSLSSPAGVVLPILDKLDLPTWEDIPEEVGQLAWESINSGWTECHRIGHFEDTCYDYDLRSAYGSVMADLLDFRLGYWVESKEMPPQSHYGFATGKVTITSRISPIVFTDWRGYMFHPKGTWNETLTLCQIRLIQEYNLGKFEVSKGYWWIPYHKSKKLKAVIEWLFRLRERSERLNDIGKRAIASIYGLMLGTNADGTFRQYTNFIWASEIEAQTQCKVARFIYDNKLENDLILVSTDGCLTTKPVTVGLGDKIGEWRLDNTGPCLAIGSSEVWYSDRRPNQLIYPEAIELVKKKPKAEEWHTKKERRVTVGDLSEGSYKPGQARQIIETGFELQFDHNRNFPSLPINGKQLLENVYTSEPYDVKALRRTRIARRGQ